MEASRKNAKPTLLRRVLACLVSAAMCVAFTPVVAWGAETTVIVGSLIVSTTDSSGLTQDTDYTYSTNTSTNISTLTIKTEKAITISSATTTDHIVVAADVTANITLSGVDIKFSNGSQDNPGTCAFEISNGAKVNLTLVGNNTLKSGRDRAGLQVETQSGTTGTLIVTDTSTGSLTAEGGTNGAGIGGGGSSGEGGNGGTVTINGGTVEATSGSGAGIGGGGGNGGGGGTFSTGSDGKAVVFASSIADNSDAKKAQWSGVIFENGQGAVYGSSATPSESFALLSGSELTIESGKTLTIAKDTTLTNNGTITNSGTIINKGTITGNGTFIGNPPVIPYVDANGSEQTTSATEITSGDTGWSGGWYVAKGDVTISQNVTFNGDVNLILADDCSLTVTGSIDGGTETYGRGCNLSIYGQSGGTGKLVATGNITGGGAMPCSGSTGGSITINGGSVKATTIKGGYGGSGSEPVGSDPGGGGGGGGDIIINGGTVEAQSIAGGDGGNGGGGGGQNSSQGPSGSVGSVLINGGVVYADSTVNGSVRGTGAVYYPLTLNDATASGSIVTRDSKTYGKAGGTIALNAGDAPTGKKLEWVVSPSTTIIEGNTLTMPSAATTVTAKFNLITYTITYVLGGGDNGGNPDTYTVESDTITLQPGKRSGYTFEGWYDGTGAKVTEIATGSTGNITLTAKWNAIYVPPATPQASSDCVKAISALPDLDAITLEDGDDIKAARSAYDALTDYQKSFVPAATLTKLEAAEQRYSDLVAVAHAEDALTELPQAADVKTSQAKKAVKKAQAALDMYSSLTDGQKALVDGRKIANAQQVVVKGAILIAKADKKAVGKVKNKAFSVKVGTSKSIYFKTLVSAAGTKVTYKKASGSSYITVSKAGRVTAKKGMKEDKTYTAKIKVTCGKSWKYVKVTVKVRG